MNIGKSVFERLLARREALRQYCFDFMPPVRDERPYSVSLEAGDSTVYVVADDYGHLGLTLESLRLTGQIEDAAGDSGGLMRLVERIAIEVAPPYGPVKCVENDEGLTMAILRTDLTADGCFFEIVVDGASVVELKHYSVDGRTHERRQTSVNMGRRVFEKLADTLAEAFCAPATAN